MTCSEITDWDSLPDEGKRHVVEKCEMLLTDIWAWLDLRQKVRTLEFLDPCEDDLVRDAELLSRYLRAIGINTEGDVARRVEEELLNLRFEGSLATEKLMTSSID